MRCTRLRDRGAGENIFMEDLLANYLDRRPRQSMGRTDTRRRASTVLAGIRAGGTTSIAFPSACSERSVAVMEAEFENSSTYRCGGSAAWVCRTAAHLLPVELQHVNHTASTNAGILCHRPLAQPYNLQPMSNQSQIDQIAERVERLLLRHAELQRTNGLLAGQIETLTQERDSLKSRLGAARARVDALLDRLPEATIGNPSGKNAP